MNVLIVRLGALGDTVHAVPAAAAIRAAHPRARIHWLVDARHRGIVDLVTVVDRVVAVERRSPAGWIEAVRALRPAQYDWAVDFQGLLKSAVLARASGARRVAGFPAGELRETSARLFYTDVQPGGADHVVRRNLRMLRALGVDDGRVAFPLREVVSAVLAGIRRGADGDRPFAVINPGAAWPNKRWPADRFGAVASRLRDRGLRTFVLWGPGESAAAQAVVDASDGAAALAPPTTVADILALCREAVLLVSGDTGPLHIAAAAGTPTVSIFGPTDPARNGPLAPDEGVVSRFGGCRCHYRRRCRTAAWCLAGVPPAEVMAAIDRRLES